MDIIDEVAMVIARRRAKVVRGESVRRDRDVRTFGRSVAGAAALVVERRLGCDDAGRRPTTTADRDDNDRRSERRRTRRPQNATTADRNRRTRIGTKGRPGRPGRAPRLVCLRACGDGYATCVGFARANAIGGEVDVTGRECKTQNIYGGRSQATRAQPDLKNTCENIPKHCLGYQFSH